MGCKSTQLNFKLLTTKPNYLNHSIAREKCSKCFKSISGLRATIGLAVPTPQSQKAAEPLAEVMLHLHCPCKSLANSGHWFISLCWPSTSSLSTLPREESLKRELRDCQADFCSLALSCLRIYQHPLPPWTHHGNVGTVKDPLVTIPSSSLLFHFEFVSLPFISFVIYDIHLFPLPFFFFPSFPGGSLRQENWLEEIKSIHNPHHSQHFIPPASPISHQLPFSCSLSGSTPELYKEEKPFKEWLTSISSVACCPTTLQISPKLAAHTLQTEGKK